MIRDSQTVLDSANALTATANGSNIIDHSSLGNLGIGEPLAVVIEISVLGTGSGSFSAALVSADDVGISVNTQTLVTIPLGVAPKANTKAIGVLPPLDTNLTTNRYYQLQYTLSGSATVTVSQAFIQPLDQIQNSNVFYPNGFKVL
jgi:hypothetical protein